MLSTYSRSGILADLSHDACVFKVGLVESLTTSSASAYIFCETSSGMKLWLLINAYWAAPLVVSFPCFFSWL